MGNHVIAEYLLSATTRVIASRNETTFQKTTGFRSMRVAGSFSGMPDSDDEDRT
jgi:hypothetical protein